MKLVPYRPIFFLLLFLLVGLLSTAAQTSASESASFDQLAAAATAAREAGRIDDAIRNYQLALKLHSDWDEGWWYLGTINYDADHYAEAVPAFKALVERNPQIGAAWGFLGLCEFETASYDDAFAHLQKAEQLGYAESPEIVKVARYHLALLFNLKGDFEKATDLLTSEFGKTRLPDQIKVALGMAFLRIPLLPGQVDPGKDALIHAAGDAGALVVDGQFDQAAQALHRMLADFPGTPYLHYVYGVALAHLSKDDEALTQLREETKIVPASPLPHIRIAMITLERRLPADALPDAQRAVKLAPQSAAAHEILAKVFEQLDKKADAAGELDTARKLSANPPEVDAAIARFYQRSVATSESAAAPAGPPAAVAPAPGSNAGFDELARQANSARDAGQTEAAVLAYQRALQLHPAWEEGWRSMGTLLFMSKRYPEATPALKNSVALDPNRSEAWALLGLSEFETGDYKNSLIHLQRGNRIGFAGNATAQKFAKYHLALLLNLNGDFDQATDVLIPEVGASPLEQQIKIALGLALLRIPILPDQIERSKAPLITAAGNAAALLAESKYDQAFVILKQLCHEYPTAPYLHYAYGNALAITSQYDEAEAQLREEIRLSPGNSLPYVRLATVSLQEHKPEDALQSAERAVQLAPDLAEAHYVLGRARLDLGKTAESINELETARKLAPNSPEVHFTLARAYAKARRADEADQERAVFERLNALVQQQKSTHGSQAYGASRSQGGLAPMGKVPDPGSTPE